MAVDVGPIYSDITSKLQNILVVFLGFLIIITVFIFFPYYFLVDTNKVVQNMDFLLNKIDDSLASLQLKSSSYPPYAQKAPNIEKQGGVASNQSVEVTSASKARINVTVTQELITDIRKNITDINQNLDNIKSINSYYKIISKKDFENMNVQVSKLNDILTKVSFQLPTNVTMLEYENSLIVPTQKLYPNSVIEKKAALQKEYDSLTEGVTELEIPIVGGFPFQLNHVLLLFPGIIAIGFPFISLHFRKIIMLNRKLRVDQADIVSWLDPLQKRPDNVYAYLTIFAPLVIFSVFIVCIFLLFYTNNASYPEQDILNEKELLFLAEDTRLYYFLFNLSFGSAAIIFSYYLIFTEWLGTGSKKKKT